MSNSDQRVRDLELELEDSRRQSLRVADRLAEERASRREEDAGIRETIDQLFSRVNQLEDQVEKLQVILVRQADVEGGAS